MLSEKQVRDRLSRLPEEGELYSTKYTAEFFGVTPQTIRNWIESKHLEGRPRVMESTPHGITGESIRKLFRDTYLQTADGEAA